MNNALTYYQSEEVVDNELYSTVITEITTNKDMFHAIWPNLAPKKELADQMARACGVSFNNSVIYQDIYGDVEVHNGVEIKKKTGIRCTMQGYKMNIDGSMQTSPPLSYEFNWESRAEEDFLNDELDIGSVRNNKPYKPKYYVEGNEHRTSLLRRKHIEELKRFPTQRAGTGAALTVIKYLTGIPSAFKEKDLNAAEWKMSFSQIVKSRKHQAAEAHARIENIRTGGTTAQIADDAGSELTGVSVDTAADFDDKFDHPSNGPEMHQAETVPPSETPPENTESQKSEKQILFESLLNDQRVSADPGMVKHYTDTVQNAQYSDQAIDWATGELQVFLGGY